ncbi:4722_t:CDS:2, partial [Ambispora leptoticha]
MLISHANQQKWTAFKLCFEHGFKHPGVEKKIYNRADKFQVALSKQISSFFRNHVDAELHDNCLWARISLYDGIAINTLPPPSNIIYLGITKTFNCKEVEELDLKGKDIASLQELLLHQGSQGSYNSFRQNRMEDNPLIHPSKRSSAIDSRKEEDSRIVSDDVISKKRETVAKDTFGSQDQPALDHYEIQVKIPLRQSHFQSGENNPITAKIRIEGINVFNGIKKMVALGIIVPPLPEFLAELQSQGKNQIVADEDGRV